MSPVDLAPASSGQSAGFADLDGDSWPATVSPSRSCGEPTSIGAADWSDGLLDVDEVLSGCRGLVGERDGHSDFVVRRRG